MCALALLQKKTSGSEILNGGKRTITEDEYQQMFNDQLEIELKGTIEIKSIEKFNEDDADVLLYVSISMEYNVKAQLILNAHTAMLGLIVVHNTFQRTKIEDLRKLWHTAICDGFNRDLKGLRLQSHHKARRAINIIPYLRLLNVEKYAEILVEEVRMLAEGSETFSQSVQILYSQIGRKVQER